MVLQPLEDGWSLSGGPMSWKLVMQGYGHCHDHSTLSGAVERKHPHLSFLFVSVLLMLLTGQTNLRPESKRAWEAQPKVLSSRAQSRDTEGRE